MRIVLIVVLTGLSGTVVFSISEDDHRRLHGLIASRNYIAAVGELERLQAADKEKFQLNNYDYLLGRIAERTKDFGLAVSSYHSVAARNSVLREYALWRLAELARSSGNPILERTYLHELRFSSRESLLKNAAANRTTRSHFENGDFHLAAAGFESIGKITSLRASSVSDRLQRENLLLLGESRLASGDDAAGREIFVRILSETVNKTQPDDLALAAVNGLDRIDIGTSERSVPELLPEEHQVRAWTYQFNREFDSARRHYEHIVNHHPAGRFSADAVHQIGRGYAQQNNFAEAIKWFERVLEQFPESAAARDALLQAGSVYARMGKFRESASRYHMFIDRFPTDERIDRAYLNLIDIARDQGEETEALRRANTAQEVFRGKTAEAQALFVEARVYLAREDWSAAEKALGRLERLPDLGGTRVPGGTSISEVRFLRGYIQEQTQRFGEAIDTYLSIPDGRSEFYGAEATERLRGMATREETHTPVQAKFTTLNLEDSDSVGRKRDIHTALRLTADQEARDKLVNDLRFVYAALPDYSKFRKYEAPEIGREDVLETPPKGRDANVHRRIADELVFLGLYDEAAPEMEAAGALRDPRDIAHFYLIGGTADRTILFAEPEFKLPADFQAELLPRDIAEMLYPVPFADELLASALQRNVDPRFLLSIVRQESRFSPTVKSNAAARGLMQFIPSTSSRIAGELRLAQFRQDDLFDPSIAILFGSQYVSDLFTLYPNQPAAVAASYNGGEDNMKRWLGRTKSEIAGVYVPEIMYSQTKDYVYKVMSNYRVYQVLYNEDLTRK